MLLTVIPVFSRILTIFRLGLKPILRNLVVPNVCINGEPIEIVKQHKLLGLCMQDDLKWDAHVDMTLKKASKRLSNAVEYHQKI